MLSKIINNTNKHYLYSFATAKQLLYGITARE